MKANNPSKTARLQERQSYINFYRKEVLKHHEISFSQFLKKPEKTRLFLALKVLPATAKVVSVAFKIPIENQCRRKRELQAENRLKVSYRDVQCKYTGQYARLLTCDKELFQTVLF